MKNENYELKKWFFDYGHDSDFKTGFIVNSVSFALCLNGYFIGITW